MEQRSEVVALPVLRSLDEVVAFVGDRADVFVRWSFGPAADVDGVSRDALTGTRLPGLCANPMAVERWWQGRPRRSWMARRLCDYEHLAAKAAKPWLLRGREVARGPDNEPLVELLEPLAWIADEAVAEAEAEIGMGRPGWGSLARSIPPPEARSARTDDTGTGSAEASG